MSITAAEFPRELARDFEKMRQANIEAESRAATETIGQVYRRQGFGWSAALTALKRLAAQHNIDLSEPKAKEDL